MVSSGSSKLFCCNFNNTLDFSIEEHITQSPEKLGQYEICQDSLCNPTIPISPPIVS